jgi:hypothetical protein
MLLSASKILLPHIGFAQRVVVAVAHVNPAVHVIRSECGRYDVWIDLNHAWDVCGGHAVERFGDGAVSSYPRNF